MIEWTEIGWGSNEPDDRCLLAKSPDGDLYITNWRASYRIFCCQSKTEDSSGWKWLYLEDL